MFRMHVRIISVLALAIAALGPAARAAEEPAAEPSKGTAPEMLQELKAYPHKIIYESWQENNFDLIMVNADGSGAVNLTKTADVDELYPKVSPDGKQICFVADTGKDKDKVRNLYLMKIDGTERHKIADNAREPCWSSDGKSIAYLPAEFKRFEYADYATKGLAILDLESGTVTQHPNPNIMHLYCLSWTPDKQWFVATVHGGMGFKHAILAIPAAGDQLFNLNLGGCRPDVSPDGKKVSWGNGDWKIGRAALDFSEATPKAAKLPDAVVSKDPMKTYHADWSPDGRYIAFSYGDKLEGKTTRIPELPGVKAMGWNICVADATKDNRWVRITLDGASNKEPDWAVVGK